MMEPTVLRQSASPDRTLLPGTEVRLAHGQGLTLACWTFQPGIDLPEHRHPHEQITTVVDGVFELSIGNEPHRLEAGDTVILPPETVHSGRSITACRVIDAFHPVREDLKR